METLVNAFKSGDYIARLKKSRMWTASSHHHKKSICCYCFTTIHYETYLFVQLVNNQSYVTLQL